MPTTEAVWRSVLVLRRQPVDARRQDRLHRRRHVDGLRGLHEPVRAALAREHPVVHEAPHALLEEERVALGPREEEPLEGLEAGVAPEQGLQQRGRTLRRERVQPELAVVGLPAPAVPVLRAVVDEEQEPGRRQALDQAVEHAPASRRRSSGGPRTRPGAAGPGSPAGGAASARRGSAAAAAGGSSASHRRSSTGTSRSARNAGSAGSRARSSVEELARDLLPDGAGLVPVVDLEVALEEVDHRQVGRGLAVRDRAGLEDQPAVGPVGVGDLPDEPRLPDARARRRSRPPGRARSPPGRAPRGAAPAPRPAPRSA